MPILPLSAVSAEDLRPLLDEEARHWEDVLRWDYSEVRAAVAAGVDRRSLQGFALLEAGVPAGYCYFIQEAGRAVVGSVFAAAAFRGKGYEESLLDRVLVEAQRDTENARVECQTLFSTASAAAECFSRAGFLSLGRHYMVRDLAAPVAPVDERASLRFMRKDDLARAADVIYRSHRGSLDAALNLTYASPATCRAFVDTLALRGGCGRFDSEASLVAEAREGVVGVLLASRLSRTSGHVCQVSVVPEAQGRGLGAQLMTAALQALQRQGLAVASLSVTVGNDAAYRLYERLGFRVCKAFGAYAWARPPQRIELPPVSLSA